MLGQERKRRNVDWSEVEAQNNVVTGGAQIDFRLRAA